MPPRALSLVARSGTGKTTLLERLLPELKERGVRVAVVKHDSHSFEMDHPGKDSYRIFAAGSDAVMLLSPGKVAFQKRTEEPMDILEAIRIHLQDMDLVLTEGFKRGPLPKLELHRSARSPQLLCRGEDDDPTLVAVASDTHWELDVPLLPLNDPSSVADFIMSWMKARLEG